jgi:hypothetical protein
MYVYNTNAAQVKLQVYVCMYAIGGVAINDVDLKKAISSCYQCIADCIVSLRAATDAYGNTSPTVHRWYHMIFASWLVSRRGAGHCGEGHVGNDRIRHIQQSSG